MLYKVDATSAQGNTISLPLEQVSEGYWIKDIEGLDPVKATITSSNFANEDGVQYQSSRREGRDLLFKMGVETDYSSGSVRALRQRLYGIFMPKTLVDFLFYDDEFPTVAIQGKVEDFNFPLFTDDPEGTISLLCFDPDFQETSSTVVNGTSVADTTEFELDYSGTVNAGTVFTLNVDRNLNGFTIYHRAPDNSMRTLEFGASLVAGDVLSISSIPGDKGVTLTRAGAPSSVIYAVSPTSSWITLEPGPNYLRIYTAEGSGVPFGIEYTNRHGGL